MNNQEYENEIEDALGDDPEVIPFKYSITSYGADYPVDSLVKRMAEKSIQIPHFQRDFVWSLNQASRFIESLLLGLPVPGIFLSKEASQKLLVIDGQQRLRTLQYFYEGIFANTGKEFALRNVQEQFEGVTYKTLKEEDLRRLDDSILHATIVKQDEPSKDDSSVYHIFERLNTGATHLVPQEIRACIYHGEFNDLLGSLNKNEAWRSIYGNVNKRMRDQELILRFFVLYFEGDSYTRPMREFLNIFMGKNRNLKFQTAELLTKLFSVTIELIHKCIGYKAFKPVRALNAAVFDAVMVGVAHRLKQGKIRNSNMVKKRYENLSKNKDFVEATYSGTAQEQNVSTRLSLATKAFGDVE